MQGDVNRRVGGRGEEWNTLWMGWKGSTTTPYSTINYLLKAAGIWDINNEEARDYGLQLGAEKDVSIIGSAEHNMCWGKGRVGGSNTNTNLHLHLIM